METRLDINTRPDPGRWAEEVSRRATPPISPPAPQTTSSHAGEVKTTSVEQIEANLTVSREKATAALGAVQQLSDMVIHVQEKLLNPGSGGGHLAQERLVQSARDTARDILDHVQTSHGPLVQIQTPTQVEGEAKKAIGAYAQNVKAFQSSQSGDPPVLRHALQLASHNLHGPHGVLARLDALDPSSPDAPNKLGDIAQTLDAVAKRFQESLTHEIDPALNRPTTGLPFDLAS